jgi:hypothetical protein
MATPPQFHSFQPITAAVSAPPPPAGKSTSGNLISRLRIKCPSASPGTTAATTAAYPSAKAPPTTEAPSSATA